MVLKTTTYRERKSCAIFSDQATFVSDCVVMKLSTSRSRAFVCRDCSFGDFRFLGSKNA
ncbi:hypothetical protein VDG1235_359 [Verrucomicrobiia bacterium DG1235]|nr:hypothetical protein VDG1235_359 [Verrucomicrobiae bacterium DG1235]